MIPDVNLKSYYLQYIRNATSDIVTYNKELINVLKIKEEQTAYLDSNIDVLNDEFNINLKDYTNEWAVKKYDVNATLYNATIKKYNRLKDDSNKIVLIQLIKYCNTLYNEYKYNQLIVLAGNRKNIKFRTYSTYVTNYYNKVHKTVLEGGGYKFSNGIGTYVVNHWKIDLTKAKVNKRIDFAASASKRKELLSKGIKIYDDNEAAWYKARSIPYNGVDYRVYKNENSFYDFTFIKSEIFTKQSLDYKRTEYIATKYRGLSYTAICDKHTKSIEDIYNLQVDIKYKLNMLLYKDPTKYLNFIRNAEQCKYKRGAHNS